MKINKERNLVIPIIRDDGSKVYVHSIPISQAVFVSFHAVLAKAFSALTDNGINPYAGLSTAKYAIIDAAAALDDSERVQSGFIGEIRRITTVLFAGEHGFEPIMLGDAIKRGIIDEEETEEVENAICFFILSMRLFLKSKRPILVEAITSLGGYLITSLQAMEWHASLESSTSDTATKETPSSIAC